MKKLILVIILNVFLMGCKSDGGSSEDGSLTNPYEVMIGEIKAGEIAANGSVFYKFDSPGGYYRIEVKDLLTDLEIKLYDDASFEVLLDSANQYTGNFDEEIFYSCDVKTYYLKVNELGGNSGTFTLIIDESIP